MNSKKLVCVDSNELGICVYLRVTVIIAMQTKEFNALPLEQRSKLVYGSGKLIDILERHQYQKTFYYKMDNLKIDVIYDRVKNNLLDIVAWENEEDRKAFLIMSI